MTDIQIDFGLSQGYIKPLHGVNNGPVCYGSLVDVSAYYKELGVPYARLHDPNWPHPREVDIPQIFRNPAADPHDPASYDFRRTDDYIQSILDTGARIVYRLGVSIEHTVRKYDIHPPRDFARWAEVCLGIIHHYNHGWADGFHHNIEYWEIWNEPDGDPNVPPEKSGMWTGTPEQYFELYRVAATAIKQATPEVKVGGFAATMINPVFTRRFVEYVAGHQLPLDFFSWHTYASHPAQIVANAQAVRKLLDEFGFGATESHLNEWNYARLDPDMKGVFRAGNEYSTQRLFERSKSVEGASFDAAALMALQDCPVDVANFYDGAPTAYWSLFNIYGVPQKNYYAFKAFRQLLDTPQRVQAQVTLPTDHAYVLAGVDGAQHEARVLLSHWSAASGEVDMQFDHLPLHLRLCHVYRLDEAHNLELTEALALQEGQSILHLHVAPYTVVLLKFTAGL